VCGLLTSLYYLFLCKRGQEQPMGAFLVVRLHSSDTTATNHTNEPLGCS